MIKKKINIFLKIFLASLLTLMIAFYLIRSNNPEGSYQNYFSKIINNFSDSAQKNTVYQKIHNWFSPTLKTDEREKLIQYQLTVLSKSIGQYFKNMLQDTQNDLLNTDMIRSFRRTTLVNLSGARNALSKYIGGKNDIREVSIFDLEGKKLIGLRYKSIPDYLITENLITELEKKENLLLKHGKTSYLILLTLVKNQGEPFAIISQTIHPSFFNRILSHLEIKENLFYLKDSHNYVLLDNYSGYQYEQSQKKGRPYDLYQALIDVDERNLKIKFEDVEYSIGVIVEKNNFWGNLFVAIFLIFIFSSSFILIDWGLNLVYKLSESTQKRKRNKIITQETAHINQAAIHANPIPNEIYPEENYLKTQIKNESENKFEENLEPEPEFVDNLNNGLTENQYANLSYNKEKETFFNNDSYGNYPFDLKPSTMESDHRDHDSRRRMEDYD